MYKLNPNSIRSSKIVQKLSPKHAARGVAQSPYPIYRHGKASLSEEPPWRAAGDPRLARSRSRVRAPGPARALHALFFSTLPSFLLREIVFSHLPHPTHGRVKTSCLFCWRCQHITKEIDLYDWLFKISNKLHIVFVIT